MAAASVAAEPALVPESLPVSMAAPSTHDPAPEDHHVSPRSPAWDCVHLKILSFGFHKLVLSIPLSAKISSTRTPPAGPCKPPRPQERPAPRCEALKPEGVPCPARHPRLSRATFKMAPTRPNAKHAMLARKPPSFRLLGSRRRTCEQSTLEDRKYDQGHGEERDKPLLPHP